MKKILLIEDNQEVRENTAEILELAGYQVATAANGKTGVAMALEQQPDLVICDIMMPQLDGYGVLHALGKHTETSGIPFIFLTAKSEKTDLRKGMEMGADDYLTKPFDGIELLNAVEVRLQKAEAIEKKYAHGWEALNAMIKETGDAKLQLTSDEREVNQYPKKQLIYTEGQRPYYVYYIISGKVKEYLIHAEGKEFITSIYGPGDFLGFMPVIEESTCKSNTQVMEDAAIMLIPAADFMQLLTDDAATAKKFVQLLAHHVSEQEERLLNMAYNSLRKKVATGLLQVAEKFANDKKEQIVLDIPRETLAQVIGSATESLIRTLSDFRSEKLIEVEEGRIILVNPKKLRDLAN